MISNVFEKTSVKAKAEVVEVILGFVLGTASIVIGYWLFAQGNRIGGPSPSSASVA